MIFFTFTKISQLNVGERQTEKKDSRIYPFISHCLFFLSKSLKLKGVCIFTLPFCNGEHRIFRPEIILYLMRMCLSNLFHRGSISAAQYMNANRMKSLSTTHLSCVERLPPGSVWWKRVRADESLKQFEADLFTSRLNILTKTWQGLD